MAWKRAAANVFDCLIELTQTVDISSPVIWLLDKVLVRRGENVVKGQVIASLESRRGGCDGSRTLQIRNDGPIENRRKQD